MLSRSECSAMINCSRLASIVETLGRGYKPRLATGLNAAFLDDHLISFSANRLMVSKANKLFFHITYPIQICYAYAIEAERVYLVSCLASEVRSDQLKDVA
jgi:hypothetical protein